MCGIVAYKGHKNCYPILLKGLKRLEYRGYDSAGIACLSSDNKLSITKRRGKVRELEAAITNKDCNGMGIAHTRWATHGRPNQVNAHPHTDQSKKIILVHNGIIENYVPIKKFLLSKKVKFKSDTDTEVLVQLIGYFYNKGKMNFEGAVRAALQRVDGAYGIVILNKDYPDMMIAARKGSPLVLGLKDSEFFIASDISPIIKHTQQILYLKDSEMVVIDGKKYSVKSINKDISLPKNIETIDYKIDDYDKGKFKYFMHKEIHEQVDTITNTMRGRVRPDAVLLHGLSEYWDEIEASNRIYITACGTSWHAGLIGKLLIEKFSNTPVFVEYASEFRYNHTLIDSQTLEGALKLKEISYIHAEGYPAAEMKHGPIALIDKNMPSVFIVPKDKTYEKIISNIQEIKSRKGKIIIVTNSRDRILKELANDLIIVPRSNIYLFIVLATIVLQLFAYHMAVINKRNVDQPRNLAKSVTVE